MCPTLQMADPVQIPAAQAAKRTRSETSAPPATIHSLSSAWSKMPNGRKYFRTSSMYRDLVEEGRETDEKFLALSVRACDAAVKMARIDALCIIHGPANANRTDPPIPAKCLVGLCASTDPPMTRKALSDMRAAADKERTAANAEIMAIRTEVGERTVVQEFLHKRIGMLAKNDGTEEWKALDAAKFWKLDGAATLQNV